MNATLLKSFKVENYSLSSAEGRRVPTFKQKKHASLKASSMRVLSSDDHSIA